MTRLESHISKKFTVYTIINSFVTLSLFRRDDEKARQVRAVLENMGLARALLNTTPFVGVVERIFACAVQIGFTLLLAWQPLLVILTIPPSTAARTLWRCSWYGALWCSRSCV